VLDCEVLDDEYPNLDRWDPRPYRSPMVHGEKISVERLERYWKAGDVRLGIRMQVCNGADNTCQPTDDMLDIYNDDHGYWANVDYWSKITSEELK
jgi:hypothetical protein